MPPLKRGRRKHGSLEYEAARQTSENGGARRDRTDDLLLAKQALSQLSYGPLIAGLGRRRWPAIASRQEPEMCEILTMSKANGGPGKT